MAARCRPACLLVCVFAAAVAEKATDIGLADELEAVIEAANVNSDLLSEVTALWTGRVADDFAERANRQLSQTQADLAPILATLTRDENDHFEPSAVRYALHHYFVRKFGWHVKGLDPEGGGWNSSSPTTIVGLLPKTVQAELDHRLHVVGLSARDTAVFALLIKHLIHANGVSRLAQAYQFLEMNTAGNLTVEKAQYALDMYMGAFLVDRDLSTIDHDRMLKVFHNLAKVYPRWPQLQELDHRMVAAEGAKDKSSSGFSFAAVNRAREAADEEFGTWQAQECRDLKQLLLTKEQAGTGRTTIEDFYAAGLNGNFQFRESIDWLRQLGALDESAKNNPRVIIENYVTGASNSVGSSRYHDIRCISDCEGLYSQIERNFVSPGVTSDELAAFISQLATPTSPAPRTLSPLQLHRLQEIGAEHGGYVPLSGRMFAQWMHHTFPRECPYPHLSGTTKPVDYFTTIRTIGQKKAKNKLITTLEQMKQIAKKKARKTAPVQMAPWEAQEELPAHFEDPTPAIWVRLQFGLVLLVFSVATAKVCSQACGVRKFVGALGGASRKNIAI